MKPTPRHSNLAAIHIAQKALGLSKDDAEALKLAITGKASAADMTAPQLRQYLAHLSGLQGRAKAPGRPPGQRSVDDAQDERWSKARALWHTLAGTGLVHTDTDAALLAYVKRQTHVEHWRFLNSYQINSVIEALKLWCSRAEAVHG